MNEDPAFEAWYRRILGTEADAISGEDRRTETYLRRWFWNFYEHHGEAAKDVAEAAFILDQLALAEQNVAVVVADITRTTASRPVIKVDDYLGAVRISFNGNSTTPSISTWENPEALVDVSGYLQEHMLDDEGMWPLSPRHGGILLPGVSGNDAAWHCRTGDHVVAPIGQLDA